MVSKAQIVVAAAGAGAALGAVAYAIYKGFAKGEPTPQQWDQFWSMGDVTRDGYIDTLDMAVASAAFGTVPGDAGWNPDADVNSDGTVNIFDINLIAKNQGLNIWDYYGL